MFTHDFLWYNSPVTMKKTLKKYFVPHRGNDFHPHILHTKRAVFYSLAFMTMKMVLVLFALLIPAEAFLLPDVLAEQYANIVVLTNAVRIEKGVLPLSVAPKLNVSSQTKAMDMAEHQYFSHQGPGNRSLSYFLRRAGYRYRVAGENLAMGFFDAQSVVNAWIKSPTHYANLIDEDYHDLGVSLESGLYNGESTVYVTQHFGDPMPKIIFPTKAKVAVGSGVNNDGTRALSQGEVHGEKIAFEDETITFASILDKQASRVYWLEENGSTVLQVRARFKGAVTSAVVYVNNYLIELSSTSAHEFVGKFTVAGSADVFFHPVIVPTIIITTPTGEKIQDTIDWYNIKVLNDNPVERYVHAKRMLSPLTKLFSVSRGIYIGFAVFFAIALVINIVVEAKKRHYHVIIQTLFLLGLLLWLIRY